MLYRPAFCCNCGEKIVREDWRLWTSRRFCKLCASENQGVDLIPKVLVGIGVLMIIYAGAVLLQRPALSNSGKAFVSQEPRPNLRPAQLYASNAASNSAPAGNTNFSSENAKQISEQPKQEKRTSEEPVFYCGAITKKGTPCTRRVKTKGTLCWQHAKSGQVAPARF